MHTEEIIVGYLVLINVLGLAVFGYDKRCAVRHRWRVPERTLLFIALLGGSIGSYAGMQIYRHKTRHWKFRAGIPAIALVEYGGIILLRWIL